MNCSLFLAGASTGAALLKQVFNSGASLLLQASQCLCGPWHCRSCPPSRQPLKTQIFEARQAAPPTSHSSECGCAEQPHSTKIANPSSHACTRALAVAACWAAAAAAAAAAAVPTAAAAAAGAGQIRVRESS